jgi:hypothetical protein
MDQESVSSGVGVVSSQAEWATVFAQAIRQARREVLIWLSEPAAYPGMDDPLVVTALRETCKSNPMLEVHLMARDREPLIAAWPRIAEAARWYGHQMHLLVPPSDLDSRFDLCCVDRTWITYVPVGDQVRGAASQWRISSTVGNPAAVKVLDETLTLLKRSSRVNWTPAGLGG